ncbi:hypothetical protein OG948_01225 [Embleya sp. NBC_00888]|uniref:hypothetical protein n=1 Tax=Embleya sp. NBC_00888 TaxID=2975960 RepID=UPI00386ED8AE|nr:hypothetical protein OG948_01225 [Embleya sp. NBC_00888]
MHEIIPTNTGRLGPQHNPPVDEQGPCRFTCFAHVTEVPAHPEPVAAQYHIHTGDNAFVTIHAPHAADHGLGIPSEPWSSIHAAPACRQHRRLGRLWHLIVGASAIVSAAIAVAAQMR